MEDSRSWWEKEKAKKDKANNDLLDEIERLKKHVADAEKKLSVSSKGTQLLTDMLQETENRYAQLVQNIEQQQNQR